MKTKTFPIELWNFGIEHFGFIRGYAVIGLKALLREVFNQRRIASHRRNLKIRREYRRRYGIENRVRLRESHHAWYMKNLEAERAKHRAYYASHREIWDRYR